MKEVNKLRERQNHLLGELKNYEYPHYQQLNKKMQKGIKIDIDSIKSWKIKELISLFYEINHILKNKLTKEDKEQRKLEECAKAQGFGYMSGGAYIDVHFPGKCICEKCQSVVTEDEEDIDDLDNELVVDLGETVEKRVQKSQAINEQLKARTRDARSTWHKKIRQVNMKSKRLQKIERWIKEDFYIFNRIDKELIKEKGKWLKKLEKAQSECWESFLMYTATFVMEK
ncbi:hypothetical protein P9265_15465 [Schinkia azotoformans]|uniref:hypothetical protein n=1 Tax=Schinkia azotoformans TaxID=1454 RepID=UPI002E22ED09|nr:hypothetical protein [Schinkia azotoformans]